MKIAISAGARYMLLSALAFSVMSLLVRVAATRLPSQEVVLVRSVISLFLSYAMLRMAGLAPWGKRKGWLVIRGLLGLVGLSAFYASLTRLPFAEANLLQFTSPAWTALFAAVFLRESLSLKVLLATALSFVGIVLVSRPALLFGDRGALPPIDVLIALSGAVFAAAAYTTVRFLRTTEEPLVIVFYYPLVSVPLVVPTVASDLIVPAGTEWLALLGVGLATQVGQIYMTKALAAEKAAPVTAISYVQVVFAAIWGFIFFAEIPDLFTVLGALIILLATLSLSLAGTKTREKT